MASITKIPLIMFAGVAGPRVVRNVHALGARSWGFSDVLCRSLPTLQSLLIEKPGPESMVVAHNSVARPRQARLQVDAARRQRR